MQLKNLIHNQIKNAGIYFKNNNFGSIAFTLGTFFLVSALPISILFYLISIIKTFSNIKFYFKSKYNLTLLIISGIMLFSTFNIVSKFNYINFIDPYKNNIIWLGLVNWIPFFLFFITSQQYLKNSNQRKAFSNALISGLIPLLFSCAMQYWFSIYGPFELMNGLIIWFQDPIINSGITGLFNNQNYTGLWLTAILPFVFTELINKNNNFSKRLFLTILISLIVYFTFLTTSRNAILGILISIFFFFRFRSLFFVPLTIIFVFLIKFSNQLFVGIEISNKNFPLEMLLNKFKFISLSNVNLSRIEIYGIASDLISQNPIYGIGSSIFPYLYQNAGGVWEAQHAHNIILEIALNFGIPSAILLTFFVLSILIKSFFKLYPFSDKNKSYTIEKSILISTLVIVVSHFFDITYYDGRISLLSWGLLSALKCIIDDKDITYNNYKLFKNKTIS
tara:strand:+ start:104 stop:1450 length:1347 start_codon:yes stop_codon:yes gene_type:complete